MARNWWLLQKHGLICFLMVATWPLFGPDPFAMFFFSEILTPQFSWPLQVWLLTFFYYVLTPETGPVSEFLIVLFAVSREVHPDNEWKRLQSRQRKLRKLRPQRHLTRRKWWHLEKKPWKCWDELPDFHIFFPEIKHVQNVGSTKIFDLAIVGIEQNAPWLPFMASLHTDAIRFFSQKGGCPEISWWNPSFFLYENCYSQNSHDPWAEIPIDGEVYIFFDCWIWTKNTKNPICCRWI